MALRNDLDTLLTAKVGGSDAFGAMRRATSALLAETGSVKPPVKLSKLATHLGARIAYNDENRTGNEEASLKLVEGAITLWVSRQRFEKSRQRALFSIAHEIAHLMIFRLAGERALNFTERGTDEYVFTERLCDFTASHLLLPRAWLAEAIRHRSIRYNDTREISKLFGVSFSALLRAVADLIPDGIVLEWRRYRRTRKEALTWRIWATFPSSPSNNFDTWYPLGWTLRHVHGCPDPGALQVDRPKIAQHLKIDGRGKKPQGAQDAILVRWPLIYASDQLTMIGNEPVPEIEMDHVSGRLMMVLGAANRLDTEIFGIDDD